MSEDLKGFVLIVVMLLEVEGVMGRREEGCGGVSFYVGFMY
jgi:hypothetical protein